MSMRVQVFEQWQGGHYFNYLRHLLPPLSALADEVVVSITKEAAGCAEFETQLGPCRALPNVRFRDDVPPANPALPMAERIRLLWNLRRSVDEVNPDFLMVPSADAQTLALAVLGHAGISIFPKEIPTEATFHYGYGPAAASFSHRLKERVYRFAHAGATWRHLNFVNFYYLEHARLSRQPWARRAQLIPDPVPPTPCHAREEARKALGIPEDGRYVGLVGSLDLRKAIPELLAAFRAANLGSKDRLLLAGRLAPEYRLLIDREYQDLVRSQRLILLDRFVSDAELQLGYSALDLACITYRAFPGLASLLLKSLAAKRPVIVNDFGWSGELVRRFGVGTATRIEDITRFSLELRAGLERSSAYVETEATRRLLEFHSVRNFTDAMLRNLRRNLGHEAPDRDCDWAWVLEAVG